MCSKPNYKILAILPSVCQTGQTRVTGQYSLYLFSNNKIHPVISEEAKVHPDVSEASPRLAAGVTHLQRGDHSTD